MEQQSLNLYHVDLDLFEGPLDLLLHLIKKEDVDLYNIPVAHILQRYLEYLQLAHELNIDLAGEFILMASELAYIKSQMLLPQEPVAEEDEGPDPREELVRRLLEYQQFKEAAQFLKERPQLNRDVFSHQAEPIELPEGSEPLIEVDTISLISAFHDVLRRMPDEHVHEVKADRISVSERMVALVERLKKTPELEFRDLFEGERSRIDLVVTFLALLEMAKLRMIRITQEGPYAPIYVKSQVRDAEDTKEEE